MSKHKGDIGKIRQEYTLKSLNKKDVDEDPIRQFKLWFDEAVKSGANMPNAMTVASADKQGKPSARTMLLKGFDAYGFVFYTNYNSKKGKELDENPYAAIVFFWAQFERQVRIEGIVERTTREETMSYFNTRPAGSQLSAWISKQSQVLKNRKHMEDLFKKGGQKFKDTDIPLPSEWGGFRLKPDKIEFWQGRPDRLHDRLVYILQDDYSWEIRRLYP